MKLRSLIIFIVLTILSISIEMQAQSLTWLGTLGGNTGRASGVSDDGLTVVGGAQDSGALYKAFMWQNSTGMVNLGNFGGNSSGAAGVSASGLRIAGTARDSLFRNRAFIYLNGVMLDIDPLVVFEDVSASDISPDGNWVVGSYKDASLNDRAYSYFAGSSLIDIGTLGGESSEAFAISGGIDPIIVGRSQTSNFEIHAFKKFGNQMDDLGTLGGDFSMATDISNNKDFIVGYSTGANHPDRAFIWTDSSGMQNLGSLSLYQSQAWSVSDNGIVVGWAYAFDSLYNTFLESAFIWTSDSGMQNLNTLYSNLIPVTGKLTFANSISANGRYIVGTGYKSNPERYEAFLLDRGNISAVADDRTFLEEFSLEQNFPNPFNPSTTISFSIPEEEFVSLKLINSLGEEVAELINEEKPAGNYSASFDASSLSSGIYFYSLTAGSFIESKKMIYLK